MNFRATGTTAYLILEGKEREFINRCRKTKSDGKPIPKQIRAKKKTLACSNSPSIGPWSMGKSLEPSNSIKRPVPGDFTKQTKCKVVSSSSSGTLIISRTKNKRPNEVKTKNKKQAKKKKRWWMGWIDTDSRLPTLCNLMMNFSKFMIFFCDLGSLEWCFPLESIDQRFQRARSLMLWKARLFCKTNRNVNFGTPSFLTLQWQSGFSSFFGGPHHQTRRTDRQICIVWQSV